MKTTINLLKKKDELTVIDAELDIYLEIPHLAYAEIKKKDGGKALLFTNVVDKKSGTKFEEPVLMNVFGSYSRCELLFGRSVESIADEITKLLHMKPPAGLMNKISLAGELFQLKNIFPKKLKGEGACQSVKYQGEDIDLYKLPVLTTWEQDGGPFITMGQVYTQSLDGEMVNLGMYRLQVYDKNHLGMHWQIHKDSSHFFDQYQKAGKKMPVSIAIGGDPLYTWCATAPLPYGVNELLMYGLITKTPAKLVKSLTTPLYIPQDVDYVIEGWVDTSELKVEGPFGDHTGYYTLEEPYPVMEVSAITTKKDRVFLATVVGKPPLEDKYMGWATGKIFFPLLKTTTPDLIDYHMPENSGFHNLILAKMQPLYKGHAKQFMHAFWGVGQMSFVKHAIFVDDKAPKLDNYESFATYVLNRFTPKSMFITEGISFAHAMNLPIDESKIPSFVKPFLEMGQKIGFLESQINQSQIIAIKVSGHGEISNYVESLATFVAVGAMSQNSGDTINYVNAEFVAKEKGIKIESEALADSSVFKNLITIKLTTAEGTTTISATIFDDGVKRIVAIDGFDIEVALTGDMILFKNSDVPGVIGSIGSTLANNNVNIADFSLSRNSKAEALAVILVDNRVDDDTLTELASLDACLSVNYARI